MRKFPLALLGALLFIFGAPYLAEATYHASLIPGQLLGTATNDSASAGNVGESPQTTIATPGTSLSNGAVTDLMTITLSPGDWAVSCELYFLPAGTTTVNTILASISTSGTTLDQTPGSFSQMNWSSQVLGANNTSITVSAFRKSLNATTTFHCLGYAVFQTSALSAWGIISARRVR